MTDGRPFVDNRGRIELGARVRLTSSFAPIELRTSSTGIIRFGDNVSVNFGSSFVSSHLVSIGSHVSIGPYCVIADDAPSGDVDDPDRSIDIGDGCWLASRVVVEPGTKIGAGTVVTAGSVVSGTIPPNVVVGGSPVRILRQLGEVDQTLMTVDSAPPAEPQPTPVQAVSARPSRPVQPDSSLMLSGLLISDFSIDPLVARLSKSGPLPAVEMTLAPYGQVVPTVLNPPPSGHDVAVIWTLPELVSPAFQRLLAGQPTSVESLEGDVASFVDMIATGLGEFRNVFVVSWTQPAWKRGLGLMDSRPGGIGWALAIVNAKLMQVALASTNLYVLDAGKWVALTGANAYSQKLWYAAKVPFVDSVFDHAADAIRSAISTLFVGPRKLLVLDLDNTLWGGVVGDVGWEGLLLGGHDAEGEAFVAFQTAVKDLRKRGILLALVSKNEEQTALMAIRSHDEMVLSDDDFVSWRINWDDKAQNIADLVRELNLGLQSVVFIDDSPFERARVRDALPEVLVPEWPIDPTDYVRALNALGCFDTVSVTEEDLARTALYAQEQARSQMLSTVSTLDEWLRQLEIKVRIDELSPANIVRSTQLLNKTNQMNLTTRRSSADEYLRWSAVPTRRVLALSVSDRVGDAGLTGLLGIDVIGDEAHVVDFVLSCRVMGRRVEEAMLSLAIEAARQLGASKLVATAIPTAKNQPCLAFFAASSMTRVADDVFEWELSEPYEMPGTITLMRVDSAAA